MSSLREQFLDAVFEKLSADGEAGSPSGSMGALTSTLFGAGTGALAGATVSGIRDLLRSERKRKKVEEEEGSTVSSRALSAALLGAGIGGAGGLGWHFAKDPIQKTLGIGPEAPDTGSNYPESPLGHAAGATASVVTGLGAGEIAERINHAARTRPRAGADFDAGELARLRSDARAQGATRETGLGVNAGQGRSARAKLHDNIVNRLGRSAARNVADVESAIREATEDFIRTGFGSKGTPYSAATATNLRNQADDFVNQVRRNLSGGQAAYYDRFARARSVTGTPRAGHGRIIRGRTVGPALGALWALYNLGLGPSTQEVADEFKPTDY